jgi:hypothetical protein
VNTEEKTEGRTMMSTAGLLLMRLFLLLAWAGNLIAVGAMFGRAWRSDQTGPIMGMGFLFAWLLLSGCLVLRMMMRSASGPRELPAPVSARAQTQQDTRSREPMPLTQLRAAASAG